MNLSPERYLIYLSFFPHFNQRACFSGERCTPFGPLKYSFIIALIISEIKSNYDKVRINRAEKSQSLHQSDTFGIFLTFNAILFVSV